MWPRNLPPAWKRKRSSGPARNLARLIDFVYHKWYTSFVATKYLSIRELRPRLPGVVRDAAATYARYIVTRRGKPEAVILSIGDYESLLETLEIEQDPALVRRLRKAQAEVKKGRKGKSLQEIDRELGLV